MKSYGDIYVIVFPEVEQNINGLLRCVFFGDAFLNTLNNLLNSMVNLCDSPPLWVKPSGFLWSKPESEEPTSMNLAHLMSTQRYEMVTGWKSSLGQIWSRCSFMRGLLLTNIAVVCWAIAFPNLSATSKKMWYVFLKSTLPSIEGIHFGHACIISCHNNITYSKPMIWIYMVCTTTRNTTMFLGFRQH